HRDHRDLHSLPTRRSSDLTLRSGQERSRRPPTLRRHWWRRPARRGYRPRHRGTRPVSWEAEYQRRLVAADLAVGMAAGGIAYGLDRKSTRLNSSHVKNSYA